MILNAQTFKWDGLNVPLIQLNASVLRAPLCGANTEYNTEKWSPIG